MSTAAISAAAPATSRVIGRERALRGAAGPPAPVAGSGDRRSAPRSPAIPFRIDANEFMVILTERLATAIDQRTTESTRRAAGSMGNSDHSRELSLPHTGSV